MQKGPLGSKDIEGLTFATSNDAKDGVGEVSGQVGVRARASDSGGISTTSLLAVLEASLE